MSTGYIDALKAAGAEVIVDKFIGSYQGDWWAKVIYQGKTAWVYGSFGSCSGCDSFEAEFGWSDEDKPDYQARLAEFAQSYLKTLYSQEDAERIAGEYTWMDDGEPLQFIKDNAIT